MSVFKLHVLPAGPGDCLVIEYGEAEELNLIVIDCGLAKTVGVLEDFLEARPAHTLELLVVSHIDLDHISGALALLANKNISPRFRDIWFNGSTSPVAKRALEAYGFQHGDRLTTALARLPHNERFGRNDIFLFGGKLPTVGIAGAEVTLLSPSHDALQRLRTEWDKHTKAQAEKQKAEAPQELEKAKAIGAGLEVYGEPPISMQQLLAEPFSEDDSFTNGSSIAFVFEYAGKRILLGADAHPKQLSAIAPQLKAERGTADVDVFKLPHHGSARNISKGLVQAYPATTYVISTSGISHGHPSDVAIARLVDSVQSFKLVFNYPHNTCTRWSAYVKARRRPIEICSPAANKAYTLDLMS